MLNLDISYETFMGSKPLRIWFDETNRFTKIYDRIRYLAMMSHRSFDEICDRIKYLISEKWALQIVLIIFFQESELIPIFLYL